MTPSAILHELTSATTLPKEALLAASRRRAEMVPLFLDEIETYLAPSSRKRRKPTPLIFIFFLLGEWRETSAYRPLARLLRSSNVPFVMEDPLDGVRHRVMAAIFDGDPQPLYDIVLDPAASEFIRTSMLDAIAMLVWSGEIQMISAAAFLVDAFAALDPETDDHLLEVCARTVGMLAMTDLEPLVLQAFGLEQICEYQLQEFHQDLAYARAHPGEPRDDYQDYAPFIDAIEELSTWPCFSTNS